MNYDAYIKAANRGDFQWEVLESNDFGLVQEETCTYKGKSTCITVRMSGDKEFEVEADWLQNEPLYIVQYRKSRKSARELAERIIRNDREGNWQKNLKYAAS